MRETKLHIVIEKQPEGGYVAYIRELPGCHTQGETKKETLHNIKEAKELYLEALKHRKTIPSKVEIVPLKHLRGINA